MHAKYLLIFCLIFFFNHPIFAQNCKCNIVLSANEIKQNQNFKVYYTIENKGKPVQIVPIYNSNFIVVDSFKTINTNKNSTKYSLELQPKQIGKFIVPILQYTIQFRHFKSEEFAITIIDSTAELLTDQEKKILAELDEKMGTKNNLSTSLSEKETLEELYEGNQIYIETYIENKNPFVGEQVNVTYYLIAKASTEIKPVEYPKIFGCWIKDITKNEDEIVMDTVVKNGSYYLRYLIYKFALFPLSEGQKKIPSLTIHVKGQLETESSKNSKDGKIANIFNFTAIEKRNVKIVSKEMPMMAKPIPTAPAAFEGLIGNYTLGAAIDTASILLNQSVILNYIIKGKGNLPFTTFPTINFGDDWEVDEPKIMDTNFFKNDVLFSSKKITYLLIPKRTGKLIIPTKSIGFFNPLQKNFELDTLTSFSIEVIGENELQKGNTNQMQDINTEKLSTKNKLLFYNWQYWISYLLPIGIVFFTFLFLKKKKKREDIVEQQLLGNTILQRLENAKQLLNTNQLQTYCSELLHIFNYYFSEKLQIPNADLNKNIIIEILTKKGIAGQDLNKYDTIEKQCTEYVYAKIGDRKEIEALHEKSIQLIQKLEIDLI